MEFCTFCTFAYVIVVNLLPLLQVLFMDVSNYSFHSLLASFNGRLSVIRGGKVRQRDMEGRNNEVNSESHDFQHDPLLHMACVVLIQAASLSLIVNLNIVKLLKGLLTIQNDRYIS